MKKTNPKVKAEKTKKDKKNQEDDNSVTLAKAKPDPMDPNPPQ